MPKRLILMTGLVLTACSVGHSALVPPTTSPPALRGSPAAQGIPVPNLVGMRLGAAQAIAHHHGWVLLVDYQISARPPGTVLSQDVPPGTLLLAGNPIGVFVAQVKARPQPKPKDSPSRKPASKPIPCPAPPLRGVYHPWRLHVLGTCRTYRGVVLFVRHEPDGDYHVVVKPDPGYGSFLDPDNYRYEHGGLVTEIMPGQSLPGVYTGEHVAIFGTWVYDATHGWQEIHPIWAITDLATGKRMFSLPVVPPRYNPEATGGPSGGGTGGGGSGCSASQGYYASSYPSAYLIYPASNPDWHSLSPTYLRHFCTLSATEAAFPGRQVDTDG